MFCSECGSQGLGSKIGVVLPNRFWRIRMVLRKWVIPIALAIVGVFVGFHLSGLEGNDIKFFQVSEALDGWGNPLAEVRRVQLNPMDENSIAHAMELKQLESRFSFQGTELPGHAAIWTLGIPISFGVVGLFIPQVLFKSGSSQRNGSPREEEYVEEELKRIDELHARGSITDEEREKMRKNVLGI
jgi:hypothetical protein